MFKNFNKAITSQRRASTIEETAHFTENVDFFNLAESLDTVNYEIAALTGSKESINMPVLDISIQEYRERWLKPIILLKCDVCGETDMESRSLSCFHTICCHHFNDKCPITGCFGGLVEYDMVRTNLPYRIVHGYCDNCNENLITELCSLCGGLFCTECSKTIHSHPAFKNHFRSTRFIDVQAQYIKDDFVRKNECADHLLPMWIYCPTHFNSYCNECTDICCPREQCIVHDQQVALIRKAGEILKDLHTRLVANDTFAAHCERVDQEAPDSENLVSECVSQITRYLGREEASLHKMAEKMHERNSELLSLQRGHYEELKRDIANVNNIYRSLVEPDANPSQNLLNTLAEKLEQCKKTLSYLSPPCISGELKLVLNMKTACKYLENLAQISDAKNDDLFDSKDDSLLRSPTHSIGDGTPLVLTLKRALGNADMMYFFGIRLLEVGSRKSLRVGFVFTESNDPPGKFPAGGAFDDVSIGSAIPNSWSFILKKDQIVMMHDSEATPVSLSLHSPRLNDETDDFISIHSGDSKDPVEEKPIEEIATKLDSFPTDLWVKDSVVGAAYFPRSSSFQFVFVHDKTLIISKTLYCDTSCIGFFHPAISMEQAGDKVSIASARFVSEKIDLRDLCNKF